MNRKIPYDRTLILIVLSLVGFGLVMVFSASSVVSRELYGSPESILTRQFLAMVVSLICMVVAMKVDYHLYEKPLVLGLLFSLTLILLCLPLLGPGVNGAHRWINLGPVNFQPSELAKLVVILITAYFLVRQGGQIEKPNRGFLLYAMAIAAIFVLVLVEPDFGTSMSLALIAAFLLFLGGLQYRFYIGLGLLSIPAFYFLVYQIPYRRDRILSFLDPAADQYGSGYQILQSLIAVGSGGVTGQGFAAGTQKLYFLPEPHTDFIFAVIGEELGLLGCLALILLFMLLFWRGVRVSLRADTLFGTLVGLGIVSMMVFQAFINISVALSLLPTKGIPLPFISVGGSSIVVMLTGVGILLNISQHTRGRVSRQEWVDETAA
ncbi:MAG TPA: putative lipid II flippase FtsW [Acidobacteriota bacterium]|nr:putative lipid II flippase FtsW [Acidobacteriota bacterium]